MIELRDLRLVVIASQYRSLRQAAEAINLRQSTLSRRLRNVEAQLGSVLFERTNGGTHPTVVGLEFITTASRILNEVDVAFRRLKAMGGGAVGQLRIGVYASYSVGNMHATLVEYHHRFPDVEVQTIDGSHDHLLCALARGVIDVAIMTSCHPKWDDRMLPLWSERVILALHETHALGRDGPIRWSDLANERILIPQQAPGPELESLMLAKLHNAGPRRIIYQESGLDRLLSLVSAEFGGLLMLEGATGVRFDGVVHREIHEDEGPTRLNFVAYWRDGNGNPTLGPFLKMLRERFPDLSAAC